MKRHFVEISKRRSAETGRSEWLMSCSCGARTIGRSTCREANADRDDHLRKVSDVPRDQQCNQLKSHRMLPGERCELCADQMHLFDLSEVEVR